MKIGIIYNGDCQSKLDCFTNVELKKLNAYTNEQKKQNWYRGRLLVKYMVNNTAEDRYDINLKQVNNDDFKKGLINVEVFPQSSLIRKPIVYINGKEAKEKVSISHKNNFTVACLDSVQNAIDIEEIGNRTTSFYQGNYSCFERMVEKKVWNKYGMAPSLYYTFLWTVKECVIKYSTNLSLTVWDAPEIELLITENHINDLKETNAKNKGHKIKSKIRIRNKIHNAYIRTQTYKNYIITTLTA